MKKTAIKTFAYSFSFSLFIILTINGAFLHKKSQKTTPREISQKNIILFLKNSPLTSTPPRAKALPVKKIMLSKLEDIKKIDKILIPDKIDVPISFENIDPQETSAPIKIAVSIPLDISGEAKANMDKAAEIAFNEERSFDEEISFDEDIVISQKVFESSLRDNSSLNNAEIVQPVKEASPILTRESIEIADLKTVPIKKIVFEKEKRLLIPIEMGNTHKTASNQKVIIASADSTNQIALSDNTVPLKGFAEDMADKINGIKGVDDAAQWKELEDMALSSSPWVVAKGSPFPKNTIGSILQNKTISKEAKKELLKKARIHLTGQGVQIATETLQNLIIPIPKDILEQSDLVPMLSSVPKDNEDVKIRPKKETAEKVEDTNFLSSVNENSGKEKSTLISSITSIFSSSKDKDGTSGFDSSIFSKSKDENSSDGNLLDRWKNKDNKPRKFGKILPVEIRLSFQPSRAEISGQTLKWLHAFAENTRENATSAIEIRIDGTNSMMLQQKRLNLLHNILTNSGVEYDKIKTVFTSREPNSFIIRTIKLKTNTNTGDGFYDSRNNKNNYMPW